ncbi:MAG: VWA domain-containing protein [Polyangiaceae bacterium]
MDEQAQSSAKAKGATEKRYALPGSFNAPASPPPMASAAAMATGRPMVEAAPTEDPMIEAAIDPNGRFATTYRPGHGHLAAFESAMSAGLLAQADRELVSDVGAHYAASFDPPEGRSLGMLAELERSRMAPTGGPVHVRLSLRSVAAEARTRPPLAIVVVLDTSGSMAGELIQAARTATNNLVDRLEPTDSFSLVTFSTNAELLRPMAPVGEDRKALHTLIDSIRETGGTNIGQGLQLGYAEAEKTSVPEDAVRSVMLLSDGRANQGIVDPGQLSGLALTAFEHDVQTSSFGLGTDYDGPLMSQIANDGAGGYYYLRDASQIASALTTELEQRLDPVATAVEVRVRLKSDVELLKVYGSRRLDAEESSRVRRVEVAADQHAQQHDHIDSDRIDDAKGGMRFFIPAFAKNDEHAILLKLRLPQGVSQRDIAVVELKYKDRISKKNVIEEVPLKVDFAESDAASAATTNASVAKTIQGFAAGDALLKASRLVAAGRSSAAAELLAERESVLTQAAETLNEPGFATDAARLARMRGLISGPAGTTGDPLVVAMVLETAGSTHLR